MQNISIFAICASANEKSINKKEICAYLVKDLIVEMTKYTYSPII